MKINDKQHVTRKGVTKKNPKRELKVYVYTDEETDINGVIVAYNKQEAEKYAEDELDYSYNYGRITLGEDYIDDDVKEYYAIQKEDGYTDFTR